MNLRCCLCNASRLAALEKEDKEVDRILGQLLTAKEKFFELGFTEQNRMTATAGEKLTEKVKELREQAVQRGVSADYVDALLKRQEGMLVSRRQVVTTLALNNYVDLQSPEFNMNLPSETFTAWRTVNRNLGRSYFQDRFKAKMDDALAELLGKVKKEISTTEADLTRTKAEVYDAVLAAKAKKDEDKKKP